MCQFFEGGTKRLVIGNAPRNPDAYVTFLFELYGGLIGELADNGVLIIGTNFREGFGESVVREFFEAVAQARLESGKAEARFALDSVAVRKNKSTAFTGFVGVFFDKRTAGIRHAKEFGALVKSLSGGVVHGSREDTYAAFGIDFDEKGIAAGNNQAQMREERPTRFFKSCGIAFVKRDKRRKEVAAQVIERQHRLAVRQCQRLGVGNAERKTAGEPGTARDGDGIDLVQIDFPRKGFEQKRKIREVFPRSQIRNDAAVLRVKRNLRIHALENDTFFGIEKRDGGFVTGALKRQNFHRRGFYHKIGQNPPQKTANCAIAVLPVDALK